jgi:rhodanese-related sulfurtransferase
MKNTLFAAMLSLCIAVPFAQAKEEGFRLVGSDEVKQWMASDAKPAIFDANSSDTRRAEGKVAGARLLSNYKTFDARKELPGDKTRRLVFYCYNEQCMASHAAAERAVKAGFKDVAVLSDGITGWKKAGGATEKAF